MRRPRRVRDAFYRVSARLGVWPRRLVAVACLLLAGLSFVDAHAPARAQAPVTVVVAAHDLAAGHVLVGSDLAQASWPAVIAPPSALHAIPAAVGSVVAGPVSAGEPVTAARLQGRGLAIALQPGQVAVGVDVIDTGSAHWIQAGDLVDLLATGSTNDAGSTTLAHSLARAVRVLAVVPNARTTDPTISITQLIIATDTDTALRIAEALNSQIVATLRPST